MVAAVVTTASTNPAVETSASHHTGLNTRESGQDEAVSPLGQSELNSRSDLCCPTGLTLICPLAEVGQPALAKSVATEKL